MNREFRVYVASDVDALVQLMGQLGYVHTAVSVTENVTAVRRAGGEVFVATLDGRVVGCISAIIDVRLAAGTNGEIVSLVVDEVARGQGMGKGLVTAAEEWLRPRVKAIRIRANAKREQAHQFYENLGYSYVKTQMVFSKDVSG